MAQLLERRGFEVIGCNWKTRICEIDVIAKRSGIIYLVEVKYRRSDFAGDGFEYITAQKMHKMSFAAEIWKQTYGWHGDYRLMAAAVSGPDCERIELIEID